MNEIHQQITHFRVTLQCTGCKTELKSRLWEDGHRLPVPLDIQCPDCEKWYPVKKVYPHRAYKVEGVRGMHYEGGVFPGEFRHEGIDPTWNKKDIIAHNTKQESIWCPIQ